MYHYRGSHSKVPDTCPMLNKILDIAKESFASEEPIGTYEFNQIESYVEDVRQINSELRGYATEYFDDKSKIEEELDDLKQKMSEYEERIAELENEIKELTQEQQKNE